MASDFADISDVEEMIGEIDAMDVDKVKGYLRRASTLIRSSVAHIDLRIAQQTLDAQTVADIATDMVIRVLRNEEGVKQETIGPTAVTYDPTVASGRLFLSPDELFTLTPPAAVRASVGTINTVPSLAPRGRFGAVLPRRRWA